MQAAAVTVERNALSVSRTASLLVNSVLAEALAEEEQAWLERDAAEQVGSVP